KEAPAIDPHYLEEPADLKALLTSMKISRAIGDGMADWRAPEVAPRPDGRTHGEIAADAARDPITHPHHDRTPKKGTHSQAVTTPDLRVHDVAGLRVADASVMPAVTSGNTNAPSLMIGERCADFLLTT